MRTLGILGGTFDPVHIGHLRLAIEVRERLGFDEVRLIPVGIPPHRGQPSAGAAMRKRMLEAALANAVSIRVDDRELNRPGPSYTVDTLRSLHAELPGQALCLILGSDAFCGLETWHRWQELPELAHLVVAIRPGTQLPRNGKVAALLNARRITDFAQLRETPAGCLYVAEIPALGVSSTYVRELIVSGRNARYLVPSAALKLIESCGVYTRAQ